jgi:hypothetical protein
MLYLLDTGVLLRLFNRTDPDCEMIRRTLWQLRKAGHRFAVSLQNIAITGDKILPFAQKMSGWPHLFT